MSEINNTTPRDRLTAFFQSAANTSFLLRFLFYFNLFQLVILVIAISLIGYQACKIKFRVPLTIFVDKSTGIATPVDYRVIDARGEARDELEVHYFARSLVENLYIFNVHTVKSNLQKVFDVCSADARKSILDILKSEDRGKLASGSLQGITEIEKSSIIETAPDLKVQLVFSKKIMGGSDSALQGRFIATLRIKTITRQEGNWNGLLVTEYKESRIREK